ncbi:MAG: substrate-binding domain-containing protein, partial [Clostridiales bacterium]|nr:substrate-binding domain-containing protein [Clostridiales bacterium]
SIMVLSVSDSHFNRATYEIAVSHNAAGIISFLEPDEEIGGLVDHFAIPVLVLGRRTDVRNVGFLRTNDEKVGELAARQLLKEGARRFAYITVDLAVSCAADRLRGFEEEVKKCGGELTVLNAYDGSLEENLIKLFQNAETAPEGIFCFNDMLAFDVQYCIEKNALPSVKLVGCDCIQQELHIPNKLTSVGPDKQKLAVRATEMIVSVIESPNSDRFTETADVFLFE